MQLEAKIGWRTRHVVLPVDPVVVGSIDNCIASVLRLPVCCRGGVRTTVASATRLGQTVSQTSCRGTTWTWSAGHTR